MIHRNEAESEQAGNFPLARMMREYLRAAMREALYEVAESELAELCGPLHRPDGQSPYRRAGSAMSTVYFEGSPERLKRPRLRRREGDREVEVKLESWKAAQDAELWEETTKRAILCGVSTRDVGRLDADQARAMSKSAVSRLWQKKAAGLVEQMQQSDLSDFDLLILMIDAVVLAKGIVATVALGIDTTGRKRVLGFRVGGSENRQVCEDLLSNLSARGLSKPAWRRLLAVLDGSDALRSALLSHYPDTLVQRCLVHKQRNLRGYLSKRHWAELDRLFMALRKAQGAEQAEEAAGAIRAFLKDKNAQARESFEEAAEDLLQLFHLEVPSTLNRSLLSTNCIENVFKNLRRHLGRVCRWRANTNQADRWMASGLKLAENGFRRIVACKDLPLLVAALRQPQKAVA